MSLEYLSLWIGMQAVAGVSRQLSKQVVKSEIVSICIQHHLFVSDVLNMAIITSCKVIQPPILYSGILSLQEPGLAHTPMKYPSLHTRCYTFQMNSLNY